MSAIEKIRTCEDVMKVINKDRSGKRLLWFLLIPIGLAVSAFFGHKLGKSRVGSL